MKTKEKEKEKKMTLASELILAKPKSQIITFILLFWTSNKMFDLFFVIIYYHLLFSIIKKEKEKERKRKRK